jgi:hypothetical protein
MNTATLTTSSRANFSAAAHMAGMNTQSIADLAAASLRESLTAPNYDATHERVNDVARTIAEKALSLTGGRATYSWEGNGIRLTYTGDTVDDQGDHAYGPTVREYLVGDEYKTTSPTPSQSGTGLLNLSLDHVRDCTDPVVEAKRQITWLLLDPSLDLVEYTIRTSTAWHGLMQTPHKLRTALAIRLAEVIEQKVLENPGGGLDLKDLIDGTNVVGYMVKTLDGSIFNLMKRIITNEAKHTTTLDTPVEDDDAYRRPVAELATEQLPQSAEAVAIGGADDLRALSQLEVMQEEQTSINAAREAAKKVRPRRAQEKAYLVARTFLSQTGLPSPVIPDVATRELLVAEMAAEEAAFTAAVKAAEAKAKEESERTGTKVSPEPVIRESNIAYESFLAWHNILHAIEDDANAPEISDEWLSIWDSYAADDTELMLNYIVGKEERLAKVVEGIISVPETMSPATKLRVRNAMMRLADEPDLNDKVSAAVDKYDFIRRGQDASDWQEAVDAVITHKASKVRTLDELTKAFDEALFSLGLD